MLEFYTDFLQSIYVLAFNRTIGWFINLVKDKNIFDVKTGDKIREANIWKSLNLSWFAIDLIIKENIPLQNNFLLQHRIYYNCSCMF